jgi:hypothetical protein
VDVVNGKWLGELGNGELELIAGGCVCKCVCDERETELKVDRKMRAEYVGWNL